MNEQNYEEVYQKLLAYETSAHKRNLRRIKVGIRYLLILPLVFLALLFITNSNKVIFLILWIVSLFIISIYLIAVEYSDYKLSHKITYILDREHEHTSLLEPEFDIMTNAIAQAIEKRKEGFDYGEDPEDLSE